MSSGMEIELQESRELGENASSALGIWTWFIGPIVGLDD